MYRSVEKNMISSKLNNIYKYANKLFLTVSLFVLIIGSPVTAITQSEAQSQIDSLNSQINQINENLKANKNKQVTLEGEIATIDGQIYSVQLQINATSAEINLLNARIDDLNTQIVAAEANLLKQKVILGEYIRQMYIDGQSSQVQLILTSNKFSDFVDKSQYLNTMQEKVKDTVGQIEAMKKDLAIKKNEVEISKSNAMQLKASQVAQRSALDTQISAKNSIAQSLVSAAKDLVKQKNDSYAQKAALSAAFNETLLGGSSDYPYGSPVPASIADDPDPWGYFIGECTSYVAWKRLRTGKPIPRAIGNGGEWTGGRAGYPQSTTPQPGDIMVFPNAGYYGHVAYVEAVGDNGQVYISEYNVKPFTYSERWVNQYNYSGAFFIH